MEYTIIFEESGFIKKVLVAESFGDALILAKEYSEIGDTFKIHQKGVVGFIHCETVI